MRCRLTVGDVAVPAWAAAVCDRPGGPFRYVEGRFLPGTIVVQVAQDLEVPS